MVAHTPGGRRIRSSLLAVLLLAILAGMVALPAARAAQDPQPARLGEFLWGLAGQESGWDYYARNRTSGAFGKYQIMPSNWPAWADAFLGDRWADQTPLNQELVARAKIRGLYRWLGSFRRVAYWWLTGDTETDAKRWSEPATRYVRNVVALMRRAPAGGDPLPVDPTAGGPSVEPGHWRRVGRDSVLHTGARTASPQAGHILDWTIVRVERTTIGRGDLLWLRVVTADGRQGWLKSRRTLPAHRPDHPERWRDGDGGGRDDRDPRSRARPRPR